MPQSSGNAEPVFTDSCGQVHLAGKGGPKGQATQGDKQNCPHLRTVGGSQFVTRESGNEGKPIFAHERAEYQPTNQQFFEAHAVIEMLLDDRDPDIIRAHVQDSNAAAKQAIFEFLTVVDPELNKARCEPIAVGLWSDLGIREKFLAYQGLCPRERRELFRRRMECGMAGTATASHPDPQCATELLAEAIPPPVPIVDNVMHEGMLLLGGRSKRGKSWLMLDLALAVSTARREVPFSAR